MSLDETLDWLLSPTENENDDGAMMTLHPSRCWDAQQPTLEKDLVATPHRQARHVYPMFLRIL